MGTRHWPEDAEEAVEELEQRNEELKEVLRLTESSYEALITEDIIKEEKIRQLEETCLAHAQIQSSLNDYITELEVLNGRLRTRLDGAHERYEEDSKHINALQAKIDALMLEYCPEEMTKDQFEEWAAHQVETIDGWDLPSAMNRMDELETQWHTHLYMVRDLLNLYFTNDVELFDKRMRSMREAYSDEIQALETDDG